MLMEMKIDDKIYVAGHNGLLGSAILRLLKKEGYENIITKSSSELDLRKKDDVDLFFKNEKPDIVILAAAKVGSIIENKNFPVEFLSDNIAIETNVINASFKYDAEKLIFISSSCVYPTTAKQPLTEKDIFTGPLEKENEAYGLAKLVGLKLCEYYNKEYGKKFISVLPTNLYGENDKFDPEHSHVITGVMTRMHDAKVNNKKEVVIWGSGNIYREFMYVDDAADAILFLLKNYNGSDVINLGAGIDLTIKELVSEIKEVVGFNGELVFDTSKPDGIYKRQLNMSKLKQLGWQPKISLKQGLNLTYEWYINHKINKLRKID